jgi:hypothetical protein
LVRPQIILVAAVAAVALQEHRQLLVEPVLEATD